jgi:hypothetical protein
MSEPNEPAEPADLPQYVLDALQRQDPEKLETISEYAQRLIEYKRQKEEIEAGKRRDTEKLGNEELDDIDFSTDPNDYKDVPSDAYVTIKTTKKTEKKSYRYYYWQWRDGNSWKNEYIGPVDK